MNGVFIRMVGWVVLAAGAQAALAGESWSGCYAGGNAGYGLATVSGHDVLINNDIGSATATGFALGGQAGCDRQAGAWVWGAQLSLDLGSLKGSHVYRQGTGPSNRVTYRVKSLATLTGRVGFVLPADTLAYLKLGGAWTRTDHDDGDPLPLGGPAFAYSGHRQATRDGWLLGLGLERRMGGRLSWFAEYSHMDFGRKTVRIPYSDGTAFDYDFRQRMDYLGAGVNVRF